MSSKKEVIEFVAEFTGEKAENINMDTAINDDLGVDGDDGSDFLSEFSSRFSIDISNIQKLYFGPEGFNPFTVLISGVCALIGGFMGIEDKYSKLKVSQLVSSVEKGVWVE